MLKIRLARMGKKNKPSFRVVVQEHRRAPQGKFVEKVGFYNPPQKEVDIDRERVQYWMDQGAQLSPTVHNLLVDAGIVEKPKVKATVGHKKKADQEEKEEKAEEKAEAEEGADKGGKEKDNNDDDRDNDDDKNGEKAKGQEEE